MYWKWILVEHTSHYMENGISWRVREYQGISFWNIMAVSGGEEFDVICIEEAVCWQAVGQVIDVDDKTESSGENFVNSSKAAKDCLKLILYNILYNIVTIFVRYHEV